MFNEFVRMQIAVLHFFPSIRHLLLHFAFDTYPHRADAWQLATFCVHVQLLFTTCRAEVTCIEKIHLFNWLFIEFQKDKILRQKWVSPRCSPRTWFVFIHSFSMSIDRSQIFHILIPFVFIDHAAEIPHSGLRGSRQSWKDIAIHNHIVRCRRPVLGCIHPAIFTSRLHFSCRSLVDTYRKYSWPSPSVLHIHHIVTFWINILSFSFRK